ncbi:MAG: CDC27 family protein [Alphaproteobacteria bacterium]|nr:CDC27 family protein [Alphaproteobacteria bacterium]
MPAIGADTLELKYHKELPGNCFGLDFYVVKPMKAAFFTRDDTLWVVFDEALAISDAKIARFKSNHIESVARIPSNKGTILHVKFKTHSSRPYGLKVIKKDTVWRLIISPDSYFRIRPLILDTTIEDDAKSINFLIKKQSDLIRAEDPVHKDFLYILPTDECGMEQSYTYVNFNILKSQNGFVISSPDKGLPLESQKDGLVLKLTEITFNISSNKDRTTQRNQKGLDSYFKHIKFTKTSEGNWFSGRQMLLQNLADKKPEDSDNSKLKLISFYLSTNNFEEAVGSISTLKLVGREGVNLLKGAFYALSGQSAKASSYLYDADLDLIPETHLWRGFTDSLQGNYKSAFDKIIRNLKYFHAYPTPIKNKLALEAAHASLNVGFSGKLFFNMIDSSALTPFDAAFLSYLKGLDLYTNKETKKAKEFLMEASRSPFRKIQILAKFSLIKIDVEQDSAQFKNTKHTRRKNEVDPNKEELQFLEALQYEWRYDDLERRVLTRLYEIYKNTKQPEMALEKLMTLFEYFPDADDRNKLADEGEEIFKAKCLDLLNSSPLDGLAFYARYINFMPIDDDKIKIYKELINALRSLSLFKQGVKILQSILKTLSDQEEVYPSIYLEIARFHYDDGKTENALKTIVNLDKRNILQPKSPLQQEKDLLKAKCLIALEKYDDALGVLENVTSVQAQEIHIRIAWRRNEWKKAASLMSAYVAQSADNRGPITARFIIEYATALSNAHQLEELKQLGPLYGDVMKKSVFAKEFSLLINPDLSKA